MWLPGGSRIRSSTGVWKSSIWKGCGMLRCEKLGVVAGLLCVVVLTVGAVALEMPTAVEAVADRLQRDQYQEGAEAGGWNEMTGFSAPMVAGMMDAYLYTRDLTYKACAELGGEFIIRNAAGAYMGDEMYALAKLRASDDDRWAVLVKGFYDDVLNFPGGILAYTDPYESIDPSAAVFYLAHLTVAAHEMEVPQVDRWREVLIGALARIDDEGASYPVMALGVATWALAKTGDLDDTRISDEAGSYWDGVRLRDLPALLAGHQVPEGSAFAGSFYWRFDHAVSADGLAAGYTEDAIYGTLGILATTGLAENVRLDDEEARIRAAAAALLRGVGVDGIVYEHLLQMGVVHYAFAGEMLQVLQGIDAYLHPEVDAVMYVACNQLERSGK